MKQQSAPANGSSRPNSLGIRGAQLEQILDSLDSAESGVSPRREFVRWPFRKQTVVMKVSQPAGLEVTMRVACRNLSRGGMSVLHNSYLHPGSECAIALPHPDPKKKFEKVTGLVVRSTHRSGAIHEVGIKFHVPIDPTNFMETDPFTDYYSLENVDPEQLKGTLLHVDDSELDRRIVGHYLRETNLRIRTSETVGEGLDMALEGVDLVLCDYYLEENTGDALIHSLRAIGNDTPVIIVTSDTSSVTRQKMTDIRADGFLAKPLNQELLMRAIGEFLLVRNNSGALKSSLEKSDPAKKMVDSFVRDLNGLADRLENCITKNDADTARSLALQIKGSAPSLGFGVIADLASKAAEAISASGSIPESIIPLRSLISACERARPE